MPRVKQASDYSWSRDWPSTGERSSSSRLQQDVGRILLALNLVILSYLLTGNVVQLPIVTFQ